jgi:lysophospholipase L1-like esterase
MKALMQKILLFSISLIFALALAEGGLRTTGHTIIKYREGKYSKLFISKAKYEKTIVLMGDSVTYGGNVVSDENYPSQLALIQNQENKSAFHFTNLGMCETNSYQMLETLKAIIHSLEFDSIILLTGAADRYNFIGLSNEKFDNKDLNDLPLQAKAPEGITTLRLYKVAKYIINRISLSSVGCFFKNCQNERDSYHEMWTNDKIGPKEWNTQYSSFKKFYDAFKNKNYGSAKDHYLEIKRFLTPGQQREVLPKKLQFEKIEYYDLLVMIADPIAYTYLKEKRFDKTITFLMDLMIELPNLFFYTDNDLNFFPYRFLHAVDFQSKTGPEKILEELTRLQIEDPNLNNKKSFLSFKEYFLNKKSLQKLIDKNLEKNLEEFAIIMKKNKKKLILQTYPSSIPYANTALRKVAKKMNLPLIDQEKLFSPLFAADGDEKYISDYVHPTVFGYRVLAENIWNHIKTIF